MKLLSSEVKNLLDKLYNLRGEDSIVLTKMAEEKDEAIATQERTKNEKAVLLAEIEKLTTEEKTLADEGNKLIEVLSKINRDDFAHVLDRLKIDFDPNELNEKLNTLLPETIDTVVSENKKASEKLANVETEMNNAVTKIEELDIRKEEALSNQAKLNEFFDLALKGNINITRDEITRLLEKFDFDENERREAAKILMFPEDALYEYDAGLKSTTSLTGKTMTEVLVEAKNKAKEVETNEEVNKEEVKETKESAINEPGIIDTFDKIIEENSENIEEEKSEKGKFEDIINSVGLNIKDFSEKNYAKLLEHYDEALLKDNVQVLKNNNIDLKVVIDNVELLYDKELKEKVEKLLAIGKDAHDIVLVPSVLVKYDLQGLNNTINVLQISGLDPKKVPLMAY